MQGDRHNDVDRYSTSHPICCHQVPQRIGQFGAPLILETVYSLAERSLKVENRANGIDLQRRSPAASTKAVGRDPAYTTAGTKRGLNKREPVQALSTQPRTHPATADTTGRKKRVNKLSKKTTPVETNHINERHRSRPLPLVLPCQYEGK
jgi:hypothetical protein